MRSLAVEEDIHRQKFEEIHNAIRSEKAWPVTDFQPGGGKRLRTIFTKAIRETNTNVGITSTELETIKVAIEMENKTHDFYRAQGRNAIYDAEKDFYEALVGEERKHYLILLDYYDYLRDPMGWSVAREHRLDAG